MGRRAVVAFLAILACAAMALPMPAAQKSEISAMRRQVRELKADAAVKLSLEEALDDAADAAQGKARQAKIERAAGRIDTVVKAEKVLDDVRKVQASVRASDTMPKAIKGQVEANARKITSDTQDLELGVGGEEQVEHLRKAISLRTSAITKELNAARGEQPAAELDAEEQSDAADEADDESAADEDAADQGDADADAGGDEAPESGDDGAEHEPGAALEEEEDEDEAEEKKGEGDDDAPKLGGGFGDASIEVEDEDSVAQKVKPTGIFEGMSDGCSPGDIGAAAKQAQKLAEDKQKQYKAKHEATAAADATEDNDAA